eukprot:Rhum_TRINITY_DN10403_c0_g2::Rhum_TRINITY_DN10403_c0_g2_i1::g.38335::m.38335
MTSLLSSTICALIVKQSTPLCSIAWNSCEMNTSTKPCACVDRPLESYAGPRREFVLPAPSCPNVNSVVLYPVSTSWIIPCPFTCVKRSCTDCASSGVNTESNTNDFDFDGTLMVQASATHTAPQSWRVPPPLLPPPLCWGPSYTAGSRIFTTTRGQPRCSARVLWYFFFSSCARLYSSATSLSPAVFWSRSLCTPPKRASASSSFARRSRTSCSCMSRARFRPRTSSIFCVISSSSWSAFTVMLCSCASVAVNIVAGSPGPLPRRLRGQHALTPTPGGGRGKRRWEVLQGVSVPPPAAVPMKYRYCSFY